MDVIAVSTVQDVDRFEDVMSVFEVRRAFAEPLCVAPQIAEIRAGLSFGDEEVERIGRKMCSTRCSGGYPEV
jgi:hypothetical protein